ncbi:hypothetical protein MASR2M66_21850 [Chloroflexota bacterium]
MKEVGFPARAMSRFIETLSTEMGHETYRAVLDKSELSTDWLQSSFFLAMDNSQAAEAYSKLQSALRTYYGRGARGVLMRIGAKLWKPILDDASVFLKIQAAIVRGLPKAWRRKPALELLARLVGAGWGNMTVHTLDLDLLFVDRASPTTLEKPENAPVCFVTFGLIRECLFWATGEEHDIEERSCKAAGAQQCEFKITLGA